MTQLERINLLSKEVLNASDMAKLFDCSKDTGYGIIRAIKAKQDRLGMAGCIHIQDYIEFYKLPIDRYVVTVVAERDKENKLSFYTKGTL